MSGGAELSPTVTSGSIAHHRDVWVGPLGWDSSVLFDHPVRQLASASHAAASASALLWVWGAVKNKLLRQLLQHVRSVLDSPVRFQRLGGGKRPA